MTNTFLKSFPDGLLLFWLSVHKLFHKSAIIFLEFIFWGFFENEFLLVHSQKTVLENFSELVVPKKWFVRKSLKKGMQLSAHISNSGHYLTIGNDLLLVLNMLWHIVLLVMLHSFISSFKKIVVLIHAFSPLLISDEKRQLILRSWILKKPKLLAYIYFIYFKNMPICQLNWMILLLTPLHVHKLRSISGRLHSLCSPHG